MSRVSRRRKKLLNKKWIKWFKRIDRAHVHPYYFRMTFSAHAGKHFVQDNIFFSIHTTMACQYSNREKRYHFKFNRKLNEKNGPKYRCGYKRVQIKLKEFKNDGKNYYLRIADNGEVLVCIRNLRKWNTKNKVNFGACVNVIFSKFGKTTHQCQTAFLLWQKYIIELATVDMMFTF